MNMKHKILLALPCGAAMAAHAQHDPGSALTLRQNADLNTTNWRSVPQMVIDDGTNRFIIVYPPAGNRFYRLFKP